ncbi:MAG: hypothetical protein NVS1B4_01570 [Gemmatimonadaceae bacterium]
MFHHRPPRALVVLTALLLPATRPLVAQAVLASDRVDSIALAHIRVEAMDRSRVMDITSWLTDVYGPRLTGSPNIRLAAEWSMKEMTGWGLTNVHLESWGPFGRGWSNEAFSLQALSPQHYPLIAYPSAWTPGTTGPVTAEVVMVALDSEPDFARYAGKLRGKIVMIDKPRSLSPHFTPDAVRLVDSALTHLAALPAPITNAGSGISQMMTAYRSRLAFGAARSQFLAAEGAVASLLDGRNDDGTVSVSATGGSWAAAPGIVLTPTVVVASEHYGRLARTLAKGIPVTLRLEDDNRFYDRDLTSFNVLGELPGSDGRLKDEVVMIGAHFDSWHSGTGATDNASGSAVMLEAMRILAASHTPLKRTVRIALWTGEEEGLLGSRAYVKRHFADPATMQVTAEHERLALYLNLDNGTGKIRGVWMQGNAAMGPIFDAWMTPFKAGGMRTLTLANTTGTDHLAFDAVGLPGFQFLQDGIDYDKRTHHTNMDVYERIQADDMKWNAMVVATFAMQAANRAEKVPRKTIAARGGSGQ